MISIKKTFLFSYFFSTLQVSLTLFYMASDQSVFQKAKSLLEESEYKRFFQAIKTLESENIPLKKTFVILQEILEMLPEFDLLMATVFVNEKSIPASIFNRHLNEFQKGIIQKVTEIIHPNLQHPENRKELVHLLFEAFLKENRIIYYFLAYLYALSKNLSTFTATRKVEYAQLLFSIGAPLAYRLGLHDMKEVLENIAFSILFHEEYKYLEKQRSEYIKEEHIFLRRVVGKIRYFLKKNTIPFTIKNRVKSLYSIYKKLKQKGKMNIHVLNDIFAVRIIVEDPLQCYLILGMLHQHFPYVPGKIKDYISKPKSNAYQSLHTTLEIPFDEQGILPVEIQIRTNEMDSVATSGIAAHLIYKTEKYNGKSINSKKEMKKKMAELLSHFSEASFLQSAEDDIFSQHIFVFGKDYSIFPLPKGATVLDFAYTLHTDIGNYAKSAFVNGKEVSLDEKLHNSDHVEIITSSITQRQENWIRIARIPEVRKTIRSYYHKDA